MQWRWVAIWLMAVALVCAHKGSFLFAVPIDVSGVRRALNVHEFDDARAIASEFCHRYKVPLAQHQLLVHEIEKRLEQHHRARSVGAGGTGGVGSGASSGVTGHGEGSLEPSSNDGGAVRSAATDGLVHGNEPDSADVTRPILFTLDVTVDSQQQQLVLRRGVDVTGEAMRFCSAHDIPDSGCKAVLAAVQREYIRVTGQDQVHVQVQAQQQQQHDEQRRQHRRQQHQHQHQQEQLMPAAESAHTVAGRAFSSTTIEVEQVQSVARASGHDVNTRNERHEHDSDGSGVGSSTEGEAQGKATTISLSVSVDGVLQPCSFGMTDDLTVVAQQFARRHGVLEQQELLLLRTLVRARDAHIQRFQLQRPLSETSAAATDGPAAHVRAADNIGVQQGTSVVSAASSQLQQVQNSSTATGARMNSSLRLAVAAALALMIVLGGKQLLLRLRRKRASVGSSTEVAGATCKIKGKNSQSGQKSSKVGRSALTASKETDFAKATGKTKMSQRQNGKYSDESGRYRSFKANAAITYSRSPTGVTTPSPTRFGATPSPPVRAGGAQSTSSDAQYAIDRLLSRTAGPALRQRIRERDHEREREHVRERERERDRERELEREAAGSSLSVSSSIAGRDGGDEVEDPASLVRSASPLRRANQTHNTRAPEHAVVSEVMSQLGLDPSDQKSAALLHSVMKGRRREAHGAAALDPSLSDSGYGASGLVDGGSRRRIARRRRHRRPASRAARRGGSQTDYPDDSSASELDSFSRRGRREYDSTSATAAYPSPAATPTFPPQPMVPTPTAAAGSDTDSCIRREMPGRHRGEPNDALPVVPPPSAVPLLGASVSESGAREPIEAVSVAHHPLVAAAAAANAGAGAGPAASTGSSISTGRRVTLKVLLAGKMYFISLNLEWPRPRVQMAVRAFCSEHGVHTKQVRDVMEAVWAGLERVRADAELRLAEAQLEVVETHTMKELRAATRDAGADERRKKGSPTKSS